MHAKETYRYGNVIKMKIHILGTRGEIEESGPYHSKQSGILIDDVLLLDLGEKSYLDRNPKWILISHFHPDHAYFIRKGHEEIPTTRAKLFAPEKPAHQEIATKIHVLDEKKKIGPYEITPIPTHHSKHVKSQAYLVTTSSSSLLYTSDMVWIDKQYHSLFRAVDMIITEASFLRKGGMVNRDTSTGSIYGHNGIPNLLHLFKDSTKKILFVHFGSWFYKNTAQARKKIQVLGKESGIKALIGYDGMTLEI